MLVSTCNGRDILQPAQPALVSGTRLMSHLIGCRSDSAGGTRARAAEGKARPSQNHGGRFCVVALYTASQTPSASVYQR